MKNLIRPGKVEPIVFDRQSSLEAGAVKSVSCEHIQVILNILKYYWGMTKE